MDGKQAVPPDAAGLLIETTSADNLVRLARKLWARQTADEQSDLMTKYDNGIGYNSADAAPVGMLLRHAERGVLSKDEAADLRSRLYKYRRQLADILSGTVTVEEADVARLRLEVTLYAKRVEHETARAVKFRFRQVGTSREFDCWFPKKWIEWRLNEAGRFEVYVPLWMAEQKDLVNGDGEVIVGPGEQVSWGRHPPSDVLRRPSEAQAKAERLLKRLRQKDLFDA